MRRAQAIDARTVLVFDLSPQPLGSLTLIPK